jgi:hypothetical protein
MAQNPASAWVTALADIWVVSPFRFVPPCHGFV